MTDTTCTSRLLGSAWPGYFSCPIAEDMYENITKVGLPQWSRGGSGTGEGAAEGTRRFRVSGWPTQNSADAGTPQPPAAAG